MVKGNGKFKAFGPRCTACGCQKTEWWKWYGGGDEEEEKEKKEEVQEKEEIDINYVGKGKGKGHCWTSGVLGQRGAECPKRQGQRHW